MDDLGQRKILKDLMEEVFENIVDYQEEMHQELEDRVFNEIKDQEQDYDIYTTIVKRDKLELVADFLFPILPGDQEEEVYNKQEIIEKIKKGEAVKITKIFLQLEYQEIQNMKKSEKIYSGTIVAEDEKYPISVKLEYNQEYIAEEEKLYNIFLENQVPWRTINNPYSRKFFNVVITGCEEDIDELTDFEEINFDFGELEDNKYAGYVPVWNIKRTSQKCEGFPIPVEDKVSYDHLISLETLGLENGYLVVPDKFNIMSVKKTQDKLIITSDESNSVSWEILKIVQNNKLQNKEVEFELMSNSKKDSFMNKFLQQKYRAPKTFAELNRIVNSFAAIERINLKEVEILDDVANKSYTYDFNSFIEDEIRSNGNRQVMLLKFTNQTDDYLTQDLLSFVISEIQMYFPEYICKGVFV